MSPLLANFALFAGAAGMAWAVVGLLRPVPGGEAARPAAGAPPNFPGLQLLLLRAGSPLGLEPGTVMALKAVLAAGLALLGLLLFESLLALGAGGLLGWGLPNLWLHERRRRRLRDVQRTFPLMLDTLALMVAAGLDFNRGIEIFLQAHPEGVLADEFRKVQRAVRLGRPRSEALLAMADRLDDLAISYFVSEVNYTDRTGSSMAAVLRQIASDLRERRLTAAERRVQTAPLRIIPPLALFSLPCLFIVILAPVIIRALEQLP